MPEYDIVSHAAMLADTGRTHAYARALAARVRPGAVVLDLGTGSGVFAVLACRAGASRVYAVESDDIIEVARQLARANGCAERITFLQGRSTAIDLPERVDGMVADVHGALSFFRDALAAVIDARQRFLRPEGWVVPARDTLFTAVASAPLPGEILFGDWPQMLDLDVSPLVDRSRQMWLRYRAAPGDLLTEPRPWTSIEYRTAATPNGGGEATLTVTRPGIGNGLCVWFDCETGPDLGYSNSPAAGQAHLNGQVFFPWPEPARLEPGDRVSAAFLAQFLRADYLWTWKTRIDRADGSPPVRFSQTSFDGTTLSADRLRRRAHTFVATPGDNARLDRRVIDLMDQGASLGTIASRLLEEFTGRFPDHGAALTHVADLSERYSR